MAEVTIERLGRDGDGMAGGLRMPGALPGEVWRTDPPALAGPPSADRAPAPCPHFGACGGCAVQHATDRFVAGWKAGMVRRALVAHGLAAEIRPILTSPERSRRRVVIGARRTRKATVVGFHGRRSGTLVEPAGCLVVRPEIIDALPVLHAITALGASRSATLRLTVTTGPAGIDVEVGGGRPLDAALRADLAAIAGPARLAWDGEPLAMARPPFQLFGNARVVPPPGAFLQATAEGEAALVSAVAEAVGPARRLADLFAGCGTFTLPLSDSAEVLAVEGEAAMASALAEGWRRTTGLKKVVTLTRDLFRRPLQPGEVKGLDAVVLDPPRAGAEAQCRALAASDVGRIAMVSCNPATFARDARILADGGFRLDWVQPVDQFRWSGHVELAARFSRGAA